MDIFKSYVVEFDKLESFGFKKEGKVYFYERLFMDGEFKAVIKIDTQGKISGTVFDIENDEEYLLLRVENSTGGFAQEVKSAFEDILIEIRDNCYNKNYFAASQSNRITNLIFEKYGDRPDFPWVNDSSGVFRNPKNAKWYGLIMDIPWNRLVKGKKGEVDAMNLKIRDDKIPELVKTEGIFPAYHMNKKYWISVVLDDTLSDNRIMELIAESHSFTEKKGK